MAARMCINNIHQGLHRVKVDGYKPPGHEWYECNRCGDQLLMQVLASRPQNSEERDAQRKGVTLVKQYESLDGATWYSVELAQQRNELIHEIENIESFLIPRTTELDEGDGFIQQDPTQVAEFHSRLLRAILQTMKAASRYSSRGETEEMSFPPGITLEAAFKLYNEEVPIGENPFYRLYLRRASIDEHCREWQTPQIAEDWRQLGKQLELKYEPKKKGGKEGR